MRLKQTKDTQLAGLDTNQYSYANYIYPIDLGAPGAGKDHYIVFHINESTMGIKNFSSGTVNGQGPTDISTLDKNRNRDAALNGTPRDPAKDTNGNSGNATPSAFDAVRQPTTRVATTIVLYMPDDINANYAAQWDAQELGVAEDISNKITGKGGWQEILQSFGASAVKNGGNVGNTLTGLSLSEAASLANRIAINNHPEVLFTGVGFRQFNFKFRFTPQTEDEAQNVDNIIRAFKFHGAPDVVTGTAGRFWIYPDEFDIQYFSNGKENLFLNKISTCALVDMQVNYTPVGHWTAHRQHSTIEGAPSVCTDISLTFKELEIMTKRRVLEGF
jgi:hypothetical protein